MIWLEQSEEGLCDPRGLVIRGVELCSSLIGAVVVLWFGVGN